MGLALQTFIGKRFRLTDPGSAGVYNDTIFWRCFWPALDVPTALFAKGSGGLKVMGSSRNVVWPEDTEFLSYYPDALYPAELAVHEAFPGERRGMVELTPEMVVVYMQAYDDAVYSFPQTHAVHDTRDDCHFLVQFVEGDKQGKPDKYVAELSKTDVADLMDGIVTKEDLSAGKTFVSVNDGVTAMPADAVPVDEVVTP